MDARSLECVFAAAALKFQRVICDVRCASASNCIKYFIALVISVLVFCHTSLTLSHSLFYVCLPLSLRSMLMILVARSCICIHIFSSIAFKPFYHFGEKFFIVE